MAVGFPAKTTYADGDVFSASDINDTNGTLNLAAGAQWAAGKNKIINGDFFVNQRNFSSQVVSTSVPVYGADRWKCSADATSGTVTYSVQQFTPGSAPVSGYESKQYGRVVTTGQSNAGTYSILAQGIENVRTLAGQTATISFWAKAASGTPKVAIEIEQYFGLGGSPSSSVRTYLNQVTISTSWARYSITASIPSISGKTFGTDGVSSLTVNLWVSAGSTYNSFTGSIGIQSNTFDIWGVQVENGSTATAFQTATGTIQGELAACQRYYWRTVGTSAYQNHAVGFATNTTDAYFIISAPSQMRVVPTAIDYTQQQAHLPGISNNVFGTVTISGDSDQKNITIFAYGASGLTTYRPYFLANNNNAAGYIGLSAEL